MSVDRAAAWAEAWDAELINLGAAGHINVRSGHGPWPRGLSIYSALRSRTEFTIEPRASEELVYELGEI